jgi:threonine synthase
VRALSEQDDHPVTLVNSVNPFRLEGQKTAAFEICDVLGRAPHILAIPVGNAGNISAYWAGFAEYATAGVVDGRPRMFGVQASGAAPYAAADADVLPVEAQMIALAPSSTAFATATTIPRSLNEPVGF